MNEINPSTVTVQQLQLAVHANSVRKGFHEKPRPFCRSIALVHSEVSEAFEAHLESDFDDFKLEVADIGIRLLDLAESHEVALVFADRFVMSIEKLQKGLLDVPDGYNGLLVTDLLMLVNLSLSKALEADRAGVYPEARFTHLEGAFIHTLRVAAYCGFSLAEAMVEKHHINIERPVMHGGKRY